jgi:hypothetical protein
VTARGRAGGIARSTLRVLRSGWRLLRAWSGDSAYEDYLSRPGHGPRLSREAFYLDSLRRRYSRPTRCC